jgi:hypothetical protein
VKGQITKNPLSRRDRHDCGGRFWVVVWFKEPHPFDVVACSRVHIYRQRVRMRLFFLSAGLGALGLTALLLVAMGTYRPEMTTLMQHVKTLKHPGLEMAKRCVLNFVGFRV